MRRHVAMTNGMCSRIGLASVGGLGGEIMVKKLFFVFLQVTCAQIVAAKIINNWIINKFYIKN